MIPDAASIQTQPAFFDECENEMVVRQYVVRHNAQGVEVVKIPPEWTWQLESVKRILECLSLGENWNSYGGHPPSLNTALTAIDLLSVIPYADFPRPRVVPIATGGIQFEWENGRRELDIEVRDDGTIEYLKVDDANPDGEEGRFTSVNSLNLKSLLTWLVTG
jgi:hypothetical protein